MPQQTRKAADRKRAALSSRGDSGAVLVEFAFVSIVFVTMIFGGLFVLMGTVAKGDVSSAASSAASFVADGGCSSASSCANGAQPPSACADSSVEESDGTMLDPHNGEAAAATVATLCELDQIIGTPWSTDDSSLQVAIYCSPDGAGNPVTPDESGQPCTDATAVTVCLRVYDTNDLPGVISPAWITGEAQDQASGSFSFDTFYPANNYNQDGSLLNCGGD